MPVLALDAGTTSTRAMVFGDDGRPLAQSQRPFAQHFPRDGWVEHDPIEIWETTVACARDALAAAGLSAGDVAALGIAVQRETVVVWERSTGRPIYNAIVWQDRRTAERCLELQQREDARRAVAKTGLLLDPYFSATKLAWILDNVSGAREAAERGDLLAGTIDTWLCWKLTEGRIHATDATNASRTLLFDIHELRWSEELCELFEIPMRMLPRVHDSAWDYDMPLTKLLGGGIPICALVGDQQAGAVGQECVHAGEAKATYGTGCFVLAHTGSRPLQSRHRLLSTIALQLEGVPTYALEGSIFNAGTVVQWLRDKLGIINTAEETAAIAASISSSGGVFCVPAFTGLGAPWWDPNARAALIGMTRDTGRAEIVRAALESVAFQTRDLANAFADDGVALAALRVDGGMTANDWLVQAVSDQTNLPVERPEILETTAWGAARLAGMSVGVYPPLGEGSLRRVARSFSPTPDRPSIDMQHAGWLDAVRRVRSRDMAHPT